jgi:hypothetical protein
VAIIRVMMMAPDTLARTHAQDSQKAGEDGVETKQMDIVATSHVGYRRLKLNR